MKVYKGSEIISIEKSGWFWCKEFKDKISEPIWVQIGDRKIVLDRGYRREIYIFMDSLDDNGHYEDITVFGPIAVPEF